MKTDKTTRWMLPLLSGLFSFLLLSCEVGLDRSNPFDPETPPEDQAKATLSGAIELEFLSGELPAVTVALDGPGQTATTTTQPDGSYSFAESVVPGRVTLRFTVTDYSQAEYGPFELTAGEATELPQVKLSRLRKAVSGEIALDGVDENGDPVTDFSGVTVVLREKSLSAKPFKAALTGRRSYQAASEGTGAFYLDGVPHGQYEISATKEGFSTYSDLIDVGGENTGEQILNPIRLVSSLGALRLADGAAYAAAPEVTAYLRASGPMARWWLSEDPEFGADATVTGEIPSGTEADFVETAFTLGAGDGVKMVYGKYETLAGLESEIASDTIVLDTTPPENGQVTINRGDTYVTAATAGLSLSASDLLSGVSGMRLSLDGALDDEPVESYALSRTVTLPVPETADGAELPVLVAFVDGAGNESEPVSDTILFDNIAPQAGATAMAINGGDAVTADAVVLLDFDVTGAAEMQVSNDSGFGDADWRAFQPALSGWRLKNADVEETKSIYARFRDAAGNTLDGIEAGIELNSRGGVSGQIALVPADTADPFQGLTFWLDGNQISDGLSLDGATGAFTISGLSRGYYGGLRVTKDRFDDAKSGGLFVEPGTTVDAGTLTLTSRYGSVSGSVSVEGDNADLTGITLKIGSQTMGDAQISGDGTFTIPSVAVGSYASMEASKSGYASAKSEFFTVLPGQTCQVGTLSLRLARGALEGWVRLVGASDDSGVLLHLEGSAYNMVSDSTGYFSRDGIVAGTYDLTAEKDGYQKRAVAAVTILPDDTTRISTPENPLQLSPQAGDFKIEGGAAYTLNTTVDLELRFENTARVRVSETAFDGADLEPAFEDIDDLVNAGTVTEFTAEGFHYAWTFADGEGGGIEDGDKMIYVQFENDGGISSEVFSASIILDRIEPVVDALTSLVIDDGDSHTNRVALSLDLVAMDENGVEFVHLSTDGSDWSKYTYTPTRMFNLPPDVTDGLQTVHARFEDPAGNVSESVTSSITLDRVPPSLVSFQIAASATDGQGNKYVKSSAVELQVEADGASQVMIGSSASFTGSVWEPYAESRVWPLPLQEGVHNVYVKFRDEAGNTYGAEGTVHDTVILDLTAPPAPDFELGGEHIVGQYANDPEIQLVFSNAPDGVKVQVSLAMAFGSDPFELPVGGTVDFSLESDEDTQVIYARYVDPAGNVSDPAQAAVTLDMTAPYAERISVMEGDFVGDQTVTLQLSAIGATEVLIHESADCQGSSWIPYVTQKSVSASGEDGPKTFSARFRDAAHNESGCVSVDFTLDTADPTVELAINDGDTFTASRSVELSLTASDGGAGEIVAMRVTNEATFTGETWESFQAAKSWMLGSGSGEKTVRVQVKDLAGNIGEDSAGITMDTQAPTIVSFEIDDDAETTNDQNVTLSVQVNDNLTDAGSLRLFISNEASFANVAAMTLEGGAGDVAWTLSRGDGSKTVYLRVTDESGNATDASDGIELDTTPPAGTISIQADSPTNSETVTLKFTAAADVEEMRIENTASIDCSTGTYESYSSQYADWSLGTESASVTVSVCFMDGAGNTYSDSSEIVLDLDAPSGVLTINEGDARTGDRSVTLDISSVSDVTSSVTSMRVTNQTGFTTEEWESFVSTRSWMLQSLNGMRQVKVQLKDAAGNTTIIQDEILLDTQPPQILQMRIDDGAEFASSTSVTVAVEAHDDQFAASELTFQLSNDPTFSNATDVEPGDRADIAWTLESTDGMKSVFLRVTDPVGNMAEAADQIKLDTTAPTVTLHLNANDPTPDRLVGLNIQADPDVAWMRLETTASIDCSGGEYGPFMPNVPDYDLGETEGSVTVSGCFKDQAGHVVSASASITLDLTDPTGSVTILGDDPTNDPTVGLRIAASNDVTEMSIANGEALHCGTAQYEPLSSNRTWSLDISTGTGTKHVSVCLRDESGRTTHVQDSAFLDLDEPYGTVTIGDGSSPINTQNVTLFLAPTTIDPNEVWKVKIANSASLSCLGTTGYVDYPAVPQMAWTLSRPNGDEGMAYVTACFKDLAGNTASFTAETFVDLLAPTATLEVEGDGYRNETGLEAFLNVMAPGDTRFMSIVVNVTGVEPDCETASYVDFVPHTSVNLLRNDAAETGIVNYVYVCLMDEAGNVGTISDSDEPARLTVDTNPPQGTLTIQGSNPTSSPEVTLEFNGVPADVMEVALVNGPDIQCENAPYQEYFDEMPWMLEGMDGERTVRACLKDHAGNTIDVAASVQLDTSAPDTPTPMLPLSEGWAKTTSPTLLWTDVEDPNGHGPVNYQVHIQREVLGSYVDLNPRTYTTVLPELALVGLIDGTSYRWRVQAVDSVGNWSSYSPFSRFTVDTEAPATAVTTVVINRGATHTPTTSVEVLFQSMWQTDAIWMRVACDGNMDSEVWIPFQDLFNCVLPSEDGLKTVYAEFADEAGNVSTRRSDTIDLDQTAPVPPVVVTEGAVTGETTVALELSGYCSDPTPGSGTASGCMATPQIKGGPDYPYWTDKDYDFYAPNPGWDVRLFSNQTNKISVRYVDNVGNESPEEFVLWRHDDLAPNGPTEKVVTSGDRSLRIKWNESTSGDVGGYLVHYGYDANFGGTFAEQGDSPIDVGKVTTYTLTGLTNDMPVYIGIAAYDKTEVPGPNEGVPNGYAIGVPMEVPIQAAGEVRGGTGSEAMEIDDMIVRKGWMYTLSNTLGLKVYRTKDIVGKEGQSVEPVGSLGCGVQASVCRKDMELFGNYLYLFDRELEYDEVGNPTSVPGLTVIDISDPTRPTWLRTVFESVNGTDDSYWQSFRTGQFAANDDPSARNWHFAYGVFKYDEYQKLNLGDPEGTEDDTYVMARIDMRDPAHPAIDDETLDLLEIADTDCNDHWAQGVAGVAAMDITSRGVDLFMRCSSSLFDKNRYYNVMATLSFDAISINPPPDVNDWTTLDGRIRDLTSSYPNMYVAGEEGMYTMTEDQGILRAFQIGVDSAHGIAVGPGWAFVSFESSSKTLKAIRLSTDSGYLKEDGSYRWPSGAYFSGAKPTATEMEGNLIYVAYNDTDSGKSGIVAFKAGDPNRFDWKTQLSSGSGGGFQAFAVDKDIIYAVSYDTFYKYRVENPEAPAEVIANTYNDSFHADYVTTLIPFGANYVFNASRKANGTYGQFMVIDTADETGPGKVNWYTNYTTGWGFRTP